MVERSRIRLLGGAVASLALTGLAGCHDPFYEGPPPGHPEYYDDYYYYPRANVYFHVYTGWYHYRDGDRWWRVRHLPPHIHIDGRHRHVVRVREREPWRRHEEHRRHYPPPRPDPGRARERDRVEREHNQRRHREFREREGGPRRR